MLPKANAYSNAVRPIGAMLLALSLLTACAGSSADPQSSIPTTPAAESPTEFATDYELPADWPADIPLPNGAELLEEPELSIMKFGEPGAQQQSLDAVVKAVVKGAPSSVYQEFTIQLKSSNYKCDFEVVSDGTYSCTFKDGTYSVGVFVFDANPEGDNPLLEGYSIVGMSAEYEDGLIDVQ